MPSLQTSFGRIIVAFCKGKDVFCMYRCSPGKAATKMTFSYQAVSHHTLGVMAYICRHAHLHVGERFAADTLIALAGMAAPEVSRERTHKRERSRSRDRHSKRSRRSPVAESAKDAKRSHRSRSRERHRSQRELSPEKHRSLDFAARQAARGDTDDRPTGKADREAQRSSKTSRSDNRDVRIPRHSRDRDEGDRHRRDSDKGHENGTARNRDGQTESRKSDLDQPAFLPGPPAANGNAKPAETKKAEPLSLEELLRKKQEEQAALAKVWGFTFAVRLMQDHELHQIVCLQPKFLSKKEREELALKRRQEDVELQKQR